eukprot:gene17899-23516_t
MDQHVDGDGAQWTNKYGPQLACTKVGEFMDATWEETKKTLELMLDKENVVCLSSSFKKR